MLDTKSSVGQSGSSGWVVLTASRIGHIFVGLGDLLKHPEHSVLRFDQDHALGSREHWIWVAQTPLTNAQSAKEAQSQRHFLVASLDGSISNGTSN